MSTDRRITDPKSEDPKRDDAAATRTKLSELATGDRDLAGRDRASRVSDTGEKSFRDQCSDVLKAMRGDLRTASGEMTHFNRDVEAGKLKPGSQEWQQRMQSAETKYQQAIQNADKRLTPEALQAIGQEQQKIQAEIQILDAAKKAGRPLSAEEMQKLGLRSNDPAKALEERKQQALTLEDLTRSPGYARANYGLALIRASAGTDQQTQAAMIQKGQGVLQEAGAKDPKMFGPPADPNFEKHFRSVVKTATGQDVPALPTTSPDRADGLPTTDAKVVTTDSGAKVVRDGSYTLPTGDNKSDDPNFKNPFTILNQVEKTIASPLSQDNINGFGAAIQAADAIDRPRLAQKMQAEQAYIESALAGPNGTALKSNLSMIDQANQKMNEQQTQMAAMIPDIVKGPNGQPNQDAVNVLNKMKECQTVEQLETYLRDPANKATLDAFRKLPKANELISTLEQFKNNDKIVHQTTEQIAKIDPNFSKAQEELAKDKALYHSSEDARAHLIRALVRDPANQNADAQKLAQREMSELAAINPNVMKDPEFQQMATFLGMRPNDKGQLEVAQPGATPGATTLDANAVKSVSTAYQTFMSVKDGQPLTAEQKAAFEQSVAAAAKINPAEVTALRQKAQQELLAKGWTQDLETKFVGLNQDVQQKFAAIPQDKQAALADIQNKIGSLPPNDATAATQRQNLEQQMQAMSTDPTVKAWLDSRVALANFYKDPKTADAIQTRLAYQQADSNLQALEHAKSLTEGLYGAALVKSGDVAGARPHLVAGAADQAALQMAPEIAQAIQKTGDAGIITDAQKAAADRTQPVTDTTGGAVTQAQMAQLDTAYKSLSDARVAMAQVKSDGQPLPKNVDDIFQKAIAETGKVEPAAITAMATQMQQKLAAGGWNDQLEAQYKKTATDLTAASQGVSADGVKKVQALQQSLANDPQKDQKFDAGLRQLAASDPTLAKYVAARDVALAQAKDPKFQMRDQYESATQPLMQLAHGKGISGTMYAAALASTNNPADLEKAKTTMRAALSGDPDLAKAFPQAAEVARQLGIVTGDQNVTTPGAAEADLAKIPGYAQLQQAEAIMKDQTLTPQQRVEKAGPLYDQAIEESKKINITKLDTDLKAIGTQLKALQDGAAALQNDPQALAKFQADNTAKFQQLQADADKLTNMRLEPMKARLLAAMAYNGAAQEMYAAAAKDPAKKDELTRAGDQMNQRAANTLKALEQADPRMWRENPTIQGAIQQANEHKPIDTAKANAVGQVLNTQKMVDFGVNGPFKAVQPLWMSLNAAGEGLQQVGKIPVIGFIPGAFGAGMSQTESIRPGAAMALAMAKSKDEGAANDTVAGLRNNFLTQGTHVVTDIGSAYAGMAIGRLAVNMVGERFGPLGQALTFATAGYLGTTATNYGLDWSASKVLGTKQYDTAELLSHSAASFGMTWGLQGLANYKAASTELFLSGSAEKASWSNSFAVWGDQTVATSMTKMRFMSGVDSTVPTAFRDNYMKLTAEGKSAVGTALQAKYTPEAFAALNPTQQYQALLGAYGTATKTTAAELAGGSGFMAKLPFSGNQAAARTTLGEIDRPWQFGGMGKFGYNFGSGAASMGIYGLGEVNPLLTNKETGEKYTWGDTFAHAGTNTLYGGFSSAVAAPLVGKAMDFMVKKPLEFTMVKPIQWLFNSEAATVAKPWTGLATAESKSFGQIAQGFTGKWTVAGDGAVNAAVTRFGVGAGTGGFFGAATHNPWMTNPETGKNYTWSETGKYSAEWAGIGGAGAVAAPYAMYVARAGIEKVGKPIYNWTAVPVVNATAKPAYNWALPTVTKVRVAAGTLSDKVVKNPSIISAYENITTSKPAQTLASGWDKYAATSLAPTALLEGQGAGDLYANLEWRRINQEADAILKAAREKDARDKAAVPAK